jgi:hypothetical protein
LFVRGCPCLGSGVDHVIGASRRFVFTRSPGFFGMSEGAATMQSWPSFLISLRSDAFQS